MQVMLLGNPPASYPLQPFDGRQLRKIDDSAAVAIRSPNSVQNNTQLVSAHPAPSIDLPSSPYMPT